MLHVIIFKLVIMHYLISLYAHDGLLINKHYCVYLFLLLGPFIYLLLIQFPIITASEYFFFFNLRNRNNNIFTYFPFPSLPFHFVFFPSFLLFLFLFSFFFFFLTFSLFFFLPSFLSSFPPFVNLYVGQLFISHSYCLVN